MKDINSPYFLYFPYFPHYILDCLASFSGFYWVNLVLLLLGFQDSITFRHSRRHRCFGCLIANPDGV